MQAGQQVNKILVIILYIILVMILCSRSTGQYNTGNDTVQVGQQVNKILVMILCK